MRLGWTFYTKYQIAFFDVRFFDPNAEKYEDKTLQQCYRKNEMEKKRNKGILKTENRSFTPLFYSVDDRMGKKTNKCYSRITKKLAEK